MNDHLKKIIILIIIITIYIGIPLSILINLISFEYKFHALTIGGVIVYLLSILLGFKNKDLGITNLKLFLSIKKVLPITFVLSILGIIIYLLGFSRITPNESVLFFVFYVFVSCPIQEFLYRGVLSCYCEFFKLKIVSSAIITSLLYSFIHIVYNDILTLVLTFMIGLIWFFNYNKSKNLLGVSISHIILGVITILTGMIN